MVKLPNPQVDSRRSAAKSWFATRIPSAHLNSESENPAKFAVTNEGAGPVVEVFG